MGNTDSTAERVAHTLGIAWPSAEEGQLRHAADAFDVAARGLEEQREACTARVRAVTAWNTGGGTEQLAEFWARYDGPDGALPATALACRQLAGALRQYADEVQKTKDSIRHKVEIAGAALVVGAVAAVFTLGTSEVAAATAATALADYAAAAGVALSTTVTDIVGTALVGAAFGAVESVAVDALVVQPLSVALHEQTGFHLGEVLHAGEFGGAGRLLAGSAGGALSRLPAAAGAAEAGGLSRLASTLDGLTRFTGSTGGRLTTDGLIGAGTTDALDGGHAQRFDAVLGAVGGMASSGGGRRRAIVDGTLPPRLTRDDDAFSELVNHRDVPKAHLDPHGNLFPANLDGLTSVVQHVIGDNRTAEVKGNSPYISFRPPDSNGKSFGANRVEVDLLRLDHDVQSGRLRGVQVLRPEQIQAEIRRAITETAGRHLDVPGVFKSLDERDAFFHENGLQGPTGRGARRLVKALQDTMRDQEWLIHGKVPSRYLSDPCPTPEVMQP